MNENTAWEPIPIINEETCGTCRHLDTTVGYLTNPMKYRCELSGELHFNDDECNIPDLMRVGDNDV